MSSQLFVLLRPNVNCFNKDSSDATNMVLINVETSPLSVDFNVITLGLNIV